MPANNESFDIGNLSTSVKLSVIVAIAPLFWIAFNDLFEMKL